MTDEQFKDLGFEFYWKNYDGCFLLLGNGLTLRHYKGDWFLGRPKFGDNPALWFKLWGKLDTPEKIKAVYFGLTGETKMPKRNFHVYPVVNIQK